VRTSSRPFLTFGVGSDYCTEGRFFVGGTGRRGGEGEGNFAGLMVLIARVSGLYKGRRIPGAGLNGQLYREECGEADGMENQKTRPSWKNHF
jgi:hypothetical protein